MAKMLFHGRTEDNMHVTKSHLPNFNLGDFWDLKETKEKPFDPSDEFPFDAEKIAIIAKTVICGFKPGWHLFGPLARHETYMPPELQERWNCRHLNTMVLDMYFAGKPRGPLRNGSRPLACVCCPGLEILPPTEEVAEESAAPAEDTTSVAQSVPVAPTTSDESEDVVIVDS